VVGDTDVVLRLALTAVSRLLASLESTQVVSRGLRVAPVNWPAINPPPTILVTAVAVGVVAYVARFARNPRVARWSVVPARWSGPLGFPGGVGNRDGASAAGDVPRATPR
jgi:hypothetical protein